MTLVNTCEEARAKGFEDGKSHGCRHQFFLSHVLSDAYEEGFAAGQKEAFAEYKLVHECDVCGDDDAGCEECYPDGWRGKGHDEWLANETRRNLGIRLGMGGGHEGAEWYTEDNLFFYVMRLEERAIAEGRRDVEQAILKLAEEFNKLADKSENPAIASVFWTCAAMTFQSILGK